MHILPCGAFSDGSIIGVEHCSKCKGVPQNGDLVVMCEECDLGYTLKGEVCVSDDAGHEDCPSNCICTAESPACVSCQKGTLHYLRLHWRLVYGVARLFLVVKPAQWRMYPCPAIQRMLCAHCVMMVRVWWKANVRAAM